MEFQDMFCRQPPFELWPPPLILWIGKGSYGTLWMLPGLLKVYWWCWIHPGILISAIKLKSLQGSKNAFSCFPSMAGTVAPMNSLGTFQLSDVIHSVRELGVFRSTGGVRSSGANWLSEPSSMNWESLTNQESMIWKDVVGFALQISDWAGFF